VTKPSSANPNTDPINTAVSGPHADTAHAGHVHAETLHPNSAQSPLKSRKSPPTSLHSSFNEGSDIDQIDEMTSPPTEVAVPDTPSEKEKKRRWRLSRKKDDAPPPSYPPVASPRPAVIGSNATAGASGTSISSSGKLGHIVTGETDRTTTNTETPLAEVSSKESRDRDDTKKISNWIKNKYREHKENVEQRRNKSPPGERTVSLGSSLMSSRGKSLDLKRTEEEKPPVPQVSQSPQAAQPAQAPQPALTSAAQASHALQVAQASQAPQVPQVPQVPQASPVPQPSQTAQVLPTPQPSQVPPPSQVPQPAQAPPPQDPKAQ
jgi:hypothetical protein